MEENDNSAPLATESKSKGLSKKTIGIIAGISAFIIAIIVGVAVFAVVRTNPNLIAADAINQLFSAKSFTFSSKTTATFKTDDSVQTFRTQDESPVKSLTVETATAFSSPAHTTSAKVTVTTSEDDDITFSVDEAYKQDGTFYLKIDGISDALENLPDEYEDFASFFEEIAEKIDDKWWKIDIPELSKELLGDTKENPIPEFYTCAVDTANKYADSQEVAKLYEQHPFVEISNYSSNSYKAISGGKLYELKFKAQEMSDFVNASSNTSLASDLEACAKKINKDAAIEKTTISASDIESAIEKLPTLVAEIDSWSHQLKAVNFNYSNDSLNITSILTFNFDKVELSYPEKSKDIKTLFEDLFELYQELFTPYSIYN